MIEIRVARRDDADDIAQAHIEGWRVGYSHLLPAEFLAADEFASVRLDRWRLWTWQRAGGEMFVPVLDDRVVGFGHCGPEGEERDVRRGEVYGFYLHPSAWGSGAADRLMAACESFLSQSGFDDAVLWVLRDNPRARRFYERAGWSLTGREATFDGPQATFSVPGQLPEVEYGINLRRDAVEVSLQ